MQSHDLESTGLRRVSGTVSTVGSTGVDQRGFSLKRRRKMREGRLLYTRQQQAPNTFPRWQTGGLSGARGPDTVHTLLLVTSFLLLGVGDVGVSVGAV